MEKIGNFFKKCGELLKKTTKIPLWGLVGAILLIMVASLFAAIVNTSFFTVSVTEISFNVEEERGIEEGAVGEDFNQPATGDYDRVLVGNLYMPRGVGKDNPRPVIIATHGAYNNKEMQLIPAIELARRGYIVFAYDQYGHGDSTSKIGAPSYSNISMRDAVYIMYKQDYVLKDSDGNGMIGVTGHSMGAAASNRAVTGDEAEYGRMLSVKTTKDALKALLATDPTAANDATKAAQVAADTALAQAKGDNNNFSETAKPYRKIATALYVGNSPATHVDNGPRTAGVIAGQFDHFFFGAPQGYTVPGSGGISWKYYVETTAGKNFLGNPKDDSGVEIEKPLHGEWYSTPVTTNGETYDEVSRIIWCPYETHPQNTWSLNSGAYTIEFFQRAFKEQLEFRGLNKLETYGVNYNEGTGQSWWIKEGFTLTALIGLALSIVPAFSLLAGLPFLSNSLISKKKEDDEAETTVAESAPEQPVSDEVQVVANDENKPVAAKEKADLTKVLGPVKWIFTIITMLVSFWFMDGFFRRQEDMLNNWLLIVDDLMKLVGVIVVSLFVATMIVRSKDAEAGKKMTKTLIRAVIAGLAMLLVSMLTKYAFEYVLDGTVDRNGNPGSVPRLWYMMNKPWINSASAVTQIAFWAAASGGMLFLFAFGLTPVLTAGQDLDNLYGLKASGKNLLSSICIAIVMLVGVFVLIALVYWIFGTDFRFYTYAIQIFNKIQFTQAWSYMPIFLIFYVAAGVSVYTNTRGIKVGWKADLMAALLMAGPAVFWLIYQYSQWALFGRSPYSSALQGIWTMGLVPTLIIAGIVSRRISQKTGNIWCAAIFNTVLFTMIAVSNTSISLQEVPFMQHIVDSSAFDIGFVAVPIVVAAAIALLVVSKKMQEKKAAQALKNNPDPKEEATPVEKE